MFADTYFFDSKTALEVAREQNKPSRYVLQVCYYNGEKIDHEGLQNLVHLPVENFVDSLALGVYRLPTKVDFAGLELSQEVQASILENLKKSLEQASIMRSELNKHYYESLKSAKLDFSEKLRFYIPASINTQVMQHISKNIADALIEMGYDVYFNLDVGVKDMNCLKELKEFNPHVTININHLNNKMLSDDVFNFVWVQDNFAIEQFKRFSLRKRDFIFHLIEHLNNSLKLMNIPSTYQPFCINTQIYKPRESVKKEKKIVFIGSSYKNNFDAISDEQKYEACEDLLKIYLKDGYIGMQKRAGILSNYKHLDSNELGAIYNYIERDLLIKEILKLDTGYELELYGYGWEQDEEFKHISKGVVSYGEDISKIYNSATYGLVVGGYVLQQRTLESAASGTIPLIFDSRESGAEDKSVDFEESVVFFETPNQLLYILKKEHHRDTQALADRFSYEKFAEDILMNIKSNLD